MLEALFEFFNNSRQDDQGRGMMPQFTQPEDFLRAKAETGNGCVVEEPELTRFNLVSHDLMCSSESAVPFLSRGTSEKEFPAQVVAAGELGKFSPRTRTDLPHKASGCQHEHSSKSIYRAKPSTVNVLKVPS